MTCPVRFTSFVLLASWAALAQTPIVRPRYVLIISVPKTTVLVGTPIEVLVTLENISGEDLTILKSRATESGELTYDVTVINMSGAPVVMTPYGRALHGKQTVPPIIIKEQSARNYAQASREGHRQNSSEQNL